MTQEEKQAISQLIRSKETHELGMQQAKLHRYDVLHEYDYKLDLLSYKASFEGNYNHRLSLVIKGDNSQGYRLSVNIQHDGLNWASINFENNTSSGSPKARIKLSAYISALCRKTYKIWDKTREPMPVIELNRRLALFFKKRAILFKEVIEEMRIHRRELNDILPMPEINT